MKLDQLLPEVALPQFAAYKAACARMLWTNGEGEHEPTLDEHAYFIPLADDAPDVCVAQQKMFLAERYGGHGIGTNGGGVRCGLSSTLQIKGIGKNMLAGDTPDYFHTYGGASLNEGIVEAIWGEIFHHTLPFGSVRVRGLIGTGTRVPLVLPEKGADPTTARVLILRDAALRPAHYMRSPFFQPMGQMREGASDTDRTRAAISTIGLALRSIYGGAPHEVQDPDYLSDCIAQMLRRFGAQIAAARAKRLMHGSLIASNIAMDGRWLDFGTVSSVPDYGHIISPRGPDFMCEELMLHPGLVDLMFYLKKYLAPTPGRTLRATDVLWKELETGMHESLPIQFIKLTGIPADRIAGLDEGLCQALYTTFQKLTASGNQRRYVIMSDNSQASFIPVHKTGDYQLNELLRIVALSASATEADELLADCLPDSVLRSTFAIAYHALRDAFFAQFNLADRSAARDFCVMNTLRLNSPLTELYRPILYRTVGKALAEGCDAPSLIDQFLARAQVSLYDDQAGIVDMSAWFDKPAIIDLQRGIMLDGHRINLRDVVVRLNPGTLPHREISLMSRQ